MIRLLVAATGLALAGAGSAAAGAPPRCAAGELQIRMARSAVAAGNVGGQIVFRDRARKACSLTGWPTLIAIGSGEKAMARHVRSTMFGPNVHGVPLVVLEPGQAAVAVFAGGDNPVGDRTTCPPAYRHLDVAPPGASTGARISAWLPYLDAYLPSCSRIVVTMVVPARDLPD